MTTRAFRDLYCEDGGIRLRFNGKFGWDNQHACSQYIEGFGCSVHEGRPLSCRLYPLGRHIQNEVVHYIFQGTQFPCLHGCPEVMQLPQLSVQKYLKGQKVETFEKAQDDYLEIMQNLADMAFELLLETGLSASGDKETLKQWREMGRYHPETLAAKMGQEWLDCLTLPAIAQEIDDAGVFTQKHNELLQSKAKEQFNALQTIQECHAASVLLMGLALHLSRAIGADPKGMAEHWAEMARQYGAQG